MEKFVLIGIGHPIIAELSPGLNRLGRNPTNDLRIADSTVSSFHCEIECLQGRVRVNDLNSTNGTFINGAQITEGELKPGGKLTLGSAEFRLELQPAEPVHVAIPEIKIETLPEPKLLEDGSPACLNHDSIPATYRCKACGLPFCDECIRVLQISGGKARQFCPKCSGTCLPLQAPSASAKPRKSGKFSFLGRLTQTIRIFKK